MRLLWLSHLLPYPSTGHGALQRSHHLLRQASLRHEVHLIAFFPSSKTSADKSFLLKAQAELDHFTASTSIIPLQRTRNILSRACGILRSAVSPHNFWELSLSSGRFSRKALEVVRDADLDLVHVDSVFLAPYVGCLSRVPYMLNHHNIESHLLFRRAKRNPPISRRFLLRESEKVRRREIMLAGAAARNCVVSALDEARLLEIVPKARTCVIPNGVDLDYFTSQSDPADVRDGMVFAGGMDWFPNKEAMLFLASEIWPALTQDRPDRRMTVVGRQPPKQLLDLSDRDRRVTVTGFVDDVRPYIDSAAIYLCPIRVGGGTRLKILDALSMQKALVSTALGVEGLGLREERHFLLAETPGEFVRQVRRLEDQPDLRQRLGEEGRRYVEEHFGWDFIGRTFNSCMERSVIVQP